MACLLLVLAKDPGAAHNLSPELLGHVVALYGSAGAGTVPPTSAARLALQKKTALAVAKVAAILAGLVEPARLAALDTVRGGAGKPRRRLCSGFHRFRLADVFPLPACNLCSRRPLRSRPWRPWPRKPPVRCLFFFLSLLCCLRGRPFAPSPLLLVVN